MLIRSGQLDPHDQRFDATQREEDEGGDDVANANLFMINGREPAGDAGLGPPDAVEPAVVGNRSGGDLRRSFDIRNGHGRRLS